MFWHHTNLSSTKPDTKILYDKGYGGTLAHYNNLFDRYGAPLINLNLIRTRETGKTQETPLAEAFANTTLWLNDCMKSCNYLRHPLPFDKVLTCGFDTERLNVKDREHITAPTVLQQPDGRNIFETPLVYYHFDFLDAKSKKNE